MRGRRAVVATFAACLLGAAPSSATTIPVTTETDDVAVNGTCSLREATQAANGDTAVDACPAGAGGDTIDVPPGFYLLAIRGQGEDASARGDLDLIGDVTVRGAAPATTVISGGGIDRVAESLSGTVTLEHLTVTGGRAGDGSDGDDDEGAVGTGAGAGGNATGAGAGAGTGGGGLFNRGGATLALVDVVVSANRAGSGGTGGRAAAGDGGPTAGAGGNAVGGEGANGGGGGGILNNTGTLTLTDSVVIGNTAGDGGTGGSAEGGDGGSSTSGGAGGGATGGDGGQGGSGGGIASFGGSVMITRSLIHGNSAGGGGDGGFARGGAGGLAFTNTAGTAGGGSGGAASRGGLGGGIAGISAQVSIVDSTLRGNRAGPGGTGGGATGGLGGNADGGGASAGDGGDVFSGNGAPGGRGGAVLAQVSGSLTVERSTFEANHAGRGGSGGSAVGGNGGAGSGAGANGGDGGDGSGGLGAPGGNGGALAGEAPLAPSLVNTTFTDNAAGRGGDGGAGTGGSAGVATGGGGASGTPGAASGGNGGAAGSGGAAALTAGSLRHSTLAANSASAGGGAAGAATATAPATGIPGSPGPPSGSGGAVDGTATFENTIAASNQPTGCAGTITNGGNNISFPEPSCTGTNADPLLGPLADNGGPTRTMAPGIGSPARDAVPASGANCEATDQRGITRPRGSGCDIGAYETAPPDATTGAASGVTETAATLNGSVNPNLRATTVRFEFGPTDAYGSATADQDAGAGSAPQTVSATLTGLSPSTTIHYRVIASNADGTTAGGDQTFTTQPAALAPAFEGTVLQAQNVRVRKGIARVRARCPATAVGACAGRLTLKPRGKRRVGRKAFSIRAGTNARVPVKLSKRARRQLRRRGRINTVATARSHDDRNAPDVTTTARVTLRR
jgi:CSLREA domain-containing protein